MSTYSKIYVYLNEIKKEKQIKKVLNLEKSNQTEINDNNTIISENEKFVSNSKLEEIRKKESYKRIIKKFANNLNSLSNYEDRRRNFDLPLDRLPLYYLKATVETAFFDFPGRLFFREIFYFARFRVSNTTLIYLNRFIKVNLILSVLHPF